MSLVFIFTVLLAFLVALANERVIEFLKSLGVIPDGYAGHVQTVLGGLVTVGLYFAASLGVNNDVLGLSKEIVEAFEELGQVVIMVLGLAGIPVQAFLAKFFHELWGKVLK